MTMEELKALLASEEWIKRSPPEQLNLLKEKDPKGFGAESAEIQNAVINRLQHAGRAPEIPVEHVDTPGERYMTRLGEDVTNLGAPFEHPLETAHQLLTPMGHYDMAKGMIQQALSQGVPENLADLTMYGGMGLAGRGLGEYAPEFAGAAKGAARGFLESPGGAGIHGLFMRSPVSVPAFFLGRHLGGGYDAGLAAAMLADRIPGMASGAVRGWSEAAGKKPYVPFEPFKINPNIKRMLSRGGGSYTEKLQAHPSSGGSYPAQRPGWRGVPEEEGPEIPPPKAAPSLEETSPSADPRLRRRLIEGPPLSDYEKEQLQTPARSKKAGAYADYLHKLGVSSGDVTKLTPENWKALARETKQYIPSSKTIKEIGDVMRKRELGNP